MPKAWLARFGRTVAEQVLDAVGDRLESPLRTGVEVSLAGERIGSWAGATPGTDEAAQRKGAEAAWLRLAARSDRLRGVLVEAAGAGGPELAAVTDGLIVRTTSAAVRTDVGNLAASQAKVTLLRLGLEGTWRGLEAGGAEMAPRLEVAMRHDGGDAETGFGLDLGGGLAWGHMRSGIEVEVSGRTLLSHEARGFRDRGLSAALTWDPRPGSERGVRLTLAQTAGASATGGMDALLGRRTLAGLADDDGDALQRRRLDVRLGYGFSALGGPVHVDTGDRSRSVEQRPGGESRLAARPDAARFECAGTRHRGDPA